jgi:hypothetical protein
VLRHIVCFGHYLTYVSSLSVRDQREMLTTVHRLFERLAPKKMASEPERAYWQLRTYKDLNKKQLEDELRARKPTSYACIAALDRPNPKLRSHLQSFDCGKPIYEDLGVDELSRFVNDRGLLASPTSDATHEGLVKLLQIGDQKIRFEKFQELAAEIRVCVYEAYIDTLPEQPDTLVPPPIAALNKQIRKEAIAIFYQRSVFQFGYYLGKRSDFAHPTANIDRFLTRLSED